MHEQRAPLLIVRKFTYRDLWITWISRASIIRPSEAEQKSLALLIALGARQS
jgi:hypothetical protein